MDVEISPGTEEAGGRGQTPKKSLFNSSESAWV